MLTEWFTYNQHHLGARGILYRDFPKQFTWNAKDKCWQPMKNSVHQVGRLVSANPAEGERYFLGVLLNHVQGANQAEGERYSCLRIRQRANAMFMKGS
jgi:hypothetical protein